MLQTEKFVAIKYSFFKPSINGKQPKLRLGEKRWPKHGVITEITTKHRFLIKLNTGEMLDKPVSRKVLKLVTSGTCCLFLNYSIDINSSLGLADAAVSESDSSASESRSRSSSGSGSSSAEESRSATSQNSKSSKSKSIKDKRYEQIKQANAA